MKRIMSLFDPLKNSIDDLTGRNTDIKKIVLHSTDVCNMNCKYCSRGMPFKQSARSYSASEFLPWLNFLIKKGIKFRTIAISGGEPFRHSNIFDFIDELKYNFPDKIIRLITNFSWASETTIKQFAPKLKNLDNCVISKYPPVIENFGGNDQFDSLVGLFKKTCPHIHTEVHDLSHFISWELHEYKEAVTGICTTEQAKCNTLGIDGIITRCVIACGAKNIDGYRSILEHNSEYFFDLKMWDKKKFLDFANKFPFDLCEHCTFTHYKSEMWRLEDRIINGELSPARD
jgi:hypothetical protein